MQPHLQRHAGRSRVRVVLVLASYAPSLLLFRVAMLRELQQRGYRVVAAGPPCEETQRELMKLDVSYQPLAGKRTSTNPIGDVAYFLRIVWMLLRCRPAAIISYTAKPVIWGSLAAKACGVRRRCAIITGVGSILMSENEGGLIARVLRFLYKLALRTCNRVAFQNPDDQHDFVKSGLVTPQKCFRVNGSGVPVQQFALSELPADPVFLLIARLLKDKGIVEYATAAREIKRRYPASRFRLVGWFDENPSALSVADVDAWVQEGAVEFIGKVDDVRPEIAQARIYVLPSYREGTPRTVLEAMAMGRAIITTDAPGCRETVRHEWNGLLVPPRDAVALAAAMERLIRDPAGVARMGVNSRELAVSNFDAAAVAKHLIQGFGL